MIRALQMVTCSALLVVLIVRAPLSAYATSAWLDLVPVSAAGLGAEEPHVSMNLRGIYDVMGDRTWQVREASRDYASTARLIDGAGDYAMSTSRTINADAPNLAYLTVGRGDVIAIDLPHVLNGDVLWAQQMVPAPGQEANRMDQSSVYVLRNGSYSAFQPSATKNGAAFREEPAQVAVRAWLFNVTAAVIRYDQRTNRTHWHVLYLRYAYVPAFGIGEVVTRDEWESDAAGTFSWRVAPGAASIAPRTFHYRADGGTTWLSSGSLLPGAILAMQSSVGLYSQMPADCSALKVWMDGLPDDDETLMAEIVGDLDPNCYEPPDPWEEHPPFDGDWSIPTTDTPGWEELPEWLGPWSEEVREKMQWLTSPLARFLWPLTEAGRWAGSE